ncbi:MAG: hypothetical protein U0798_21650 [Gemmataceae bacterium]
MSGNDYLVAWVVQRSLGGHSVPLDEPALRVLRRLNIIPPTGEDLEAIRGTVEHHVPKSKGVEFTELLSSFASSICTDTRPNCKGCPLLDDCPTGQDLLSTSKKPAKAEKGEKAEKDKAEKPEKGEKGEKAEKSEKGSSKKSK